MAENTTITPADLFDNAIKDYQAGKSPAELIPVFVNICNRSAKLASAWTCLSWLYLLEDKPQLALKAAQKAAKLEPYDAQSRINLVLAMLETKQSGVREHIHMIQQLILTPEIQEQVTENMKDGFSRKPEWASLKRIEAWISEEN
jgi:predicted Zn-dependent protease